MIFTSKLLLIYVLIAGGYFSPAHLVLANVEQVKLRLYFAQSSSKDDSSLCQICL